MYPTSITFDFYQTKVSNNNSDLEINGSGCNKMRSSRKSTDGLNLL